MSEISSDPGSQGKRPTRYRPEMLLRAVINDNARTLETLTRLGYHCADCVVLYEDTVAMAADLHEKSLDELLAALNDTPLPRPEDSEGWKMAEQVRALEDAHFARVEAGRVEIAAILTELGARRQNPEQNSELEAAYDRIWHIFGRLLQEQAAFEKQRGKVLAAKREQIAMEFASTLLQARPGHPDVLSLLLPGIERRAADLAAWRALAQLPTPEPPAGGSPSGA